MADNNEVINESNVQDSLKTEERRVSKGVIRRRLSKVELTGDDNSKNDNSKDISEEHLTSDMSAGSLSSQSQAEVSPDNTQSKENPVHDLNNHEFVQNKLNKNEEIGALNINIKAEGEQSGLADLNAKNNKFGTAGSTENLQKENKDNSVSNANLKTEKPAVLPLNAVKGLVNGLKDAAELNTPENKSLKKNTVKKQNVVKPKKNEKIIDLIEEKEYVAPRKPRKRFKAYKDFNKHNEYNSTLITEKKQSKKVIKISNGITVNELSQAIGVKASEVIKKLLDVDIIATINQIIDIDAASLITSEYGYTVENVSFDEVVALEESPDAEESLVPRAPVVTVMGHVDHGKTSLLDAIRKTNVTTNEAGGITQHIGAYNVKVDDSMVVFLDTPGHEAFTEMRARGAGITDIVILVVAADDGVMPQTIEAINHAKAANVPIIVAINKIDKPGANPEKIKNSLMEYGLVSEELGGSTLFSSVSAKTGQGLKELLELIILQAEILELKANPNKPARGTVIEASLDKGRGPVATVLVQSGTLHINDSAVCGLYFVKVRAMMDYNGNKLEKAGPSTPVEIFGLEGVPSAGDSFIVLKDEKEAKKISMERQLKRRESEYRSSSKMTLENLYSKIKAGDVKELKLIVKSDVFGSMEALIQSFNKLSTDKVKVVIIHSGASAITESDIMLAKATGSIVIAFNVRPEPKALTLSETENIEIRYYNIIYDAVKDIKDAMEGLLAPIEKEIVVGKAEVRSVFNVPKIGAVAGCMVTSGVVKRAAGARLLRDNVIIYSGHIDSLKRFKDDVKEVQSNFECGISLENFNDIKINDVIEIYEIEYIKQTL
ncbi:MAG: translation initiation factor IF-2 [Candidatus Acididesulfobacter guangdongensis]|uniref:Translation initiation factor IF-2 n=1 Tax=Acididesulfobacter guangdongensis TaxID=2597225 RepID=A0A519BED2_ACIG2|nr:MAG: translation initiation factor IF-2 [Candidatus Acididesulfobacter guangdongensis]